MSRPYLFLNYVLDQMAFIHGLNARAMFGGHGIYQDEMIFAIIVHDMLYLKTNDQTRGDFEAKGLGPFSYTARGKTMTMPYYEAPAEVFEEVDAMRFWTNKALQAALVSNAGKSGKRKQAPADH